MANVKDMHDASIAPLSRPSMRRWNFSRYWDRTYLWGLKYLSHTGSQSTNCLFAITQSIPAAVEIAERCDEIVCRENQGKKKKAVFRVSAHFSGTILKKN